MCIREITALEFAFNAHNGQKRKYTNEPYINHCIAVADIVKTVTDDINVICAAYLHDTIEDTYIDENIIEYKFNSDVAKLVLEVTDISIKQDGNRKQRKEIDRIHLSKASDRGKLIKLADIIHNTQSIAMYDQKFAKIYKEEKLALLPHLREGNERLYQAAFKIIEAI